MELRPRIFCLSLLFLFGMGFHFASAQNSFPQQILFEKYTSVACGSCGNGVLILEDLIQKYPEIIPVAIHSSVFDPMKIADGWAAFKYYGNGTPVANVNRTAAASSSSTWNSKIINEQNKCSVVKVEIAQMAYDKLSRELSVTVLATFSDSLAKDDGPFQGDFRLNLFVLENNVTGGYLYDQRNYFNTTPGHPHFGLGHPIPGFVHQHVLRAMLGGTWGANDEGIQPDVWPGQSVSQTFKYRISEDMDPYEIELIPIVQSFGSGLNDRKIMNSNRSKLALILSNEEAIRFENELKIFPNPSSGNVNILLEKREAKSISIQIFDLNGKIVFEAKEFEQVIWEAKDVPNGVYFARIKMDDQYFQQKIILQH